MGNLLGPPVHVIINTGPLLKQDMHPCLIEPSLLAPYKEIQHPPTPLQTKYPQGEISMVSFLASVVSLGNLNTGRQTAVTLSLKDIGRGGPEPKLIE